MRVIKPPLTWAGQLDELKSLKHKYPIPSDMDIISITRRHLGGCTGEARRGWASGPYDRKSMQRGARHLRVGLVFYLPLASLLMPLRLVLFYLMVRSVELHNPPAHTTTWNLIC